MGTRADFYVGRGEAAEWIGSIAWDGYRKGIPRAVLRAKNEEKFRTAVRTILGKREDFTSPEDGWPWPWNDSGTTDCTYHWDSNLGRVVSNPRGEAFPDMRKHQNVTFGARSGLILVIAR